MLTKPVYLEIDKPNYVPIYTVQYDYNSRFYEITILNNSQPLDLTGIRVIVAGKKPDGKEVFNSCKVLDAKKGLIQLELTEQMNAVNGASEYALELFSADGMLSSQPFKLIVTRSTISKTVESSKELGALKDALNEVQDIDNRFAQTNAQLSELANKGTTVEVLERVTKEEIDRQIADGTMANLTIADGSITHEKICPGSIGTYELSSEIIDKKPLNLFNKEDVVFGYIKANSGEVIDSANDADRTSNFIEVEEYTTYFKNPKSSSSVNKQGIAFYDEYKRYISGIAMEIGEYSFKTPHGCKYLRMDCLAEYLDTEMLVKGEVPEIYGPFNRTPVLNADLLRIDSVEKIVTSDKIRKNVFDLVLGELVNDTLFVSGKSVELGGSVYKDGDSLILNGGYCKMPFPLDKKGILSGHVKGEITSNLLSSSGSAIFSSIVEEPPYYGIMIRIRKTGEVVTLELVSSTAITRITIPSEHIQENDGMFTLSLDFNFTVNLTSGSGVITENITGQSANLKVNPSLMIGEDFYTVGCNTAYLNSPEHFVIKKFEIDSASTETAIINYDGDMVELPNLCMPNTNIPIYSLINSSGNSNSVNLTTEFGNKVSLTVKNDGTITENLKPIKTLPSDFPTYTITGESPYDYNFLVTPHTTNYDTGYIFIMNNKGNVLWYKKTNAYCYAFKKYTSPKGKNRYTYIEVTTKNEPTADNATFYEHGDLVVLNENFDEIDRVRFKKTEHIPHNHPIEQHDYIYFDDGHYLVMLYHKKKGSPLFENHIQEIKMGKAVWNWTTIDYPILKTLSHTSQTSDYAHVNSIQIDYDDNFIVSFRNIGIIKINRESKEIMWVMGRKRNDFSGLESRELPFQQHDIQFAPDGSFTVFDNYGHESKSRVCRYFLDEETMTCLAFREYVTTQNRSDYMGSATIIDDENDIIDIAYGSGWSHIAFEEYDFKNNRQIMMLCFDDGYDLYRIFRDIDFKNTSKFNLNVN